jgi:diguanylate cyclase (GGDEF)-like protein/excisionase family DNA binding protein
MPMMRAASCVTGDHLGERAGTGWLRVTEVAELLGISANTVRRWTDAGKITAHRSPGGHRRFRTADVLAMLPAGFTEAASPPTDDDALRRETRDLQATIDAGLDLTRVMTETPRELPRELGRRLCHLTGAARTEVYTLEEGKLQLIAAMEGDEPEPSRTGEQWPAEDWSPVHLNGVVPAPTFLSVDDKGLTPRARQALRRRGCRSLAWAPMHTGDRVVGAVEVSDARRVDLSRHLPIIASFANLCAHGLGLESTYEQLAGRERAMQELIALSHEIAATHDIEGFVQDLAQRLMTSVHADDVDIWRVKDGRVTCLVSLNRNGVDPSLKGTTMDLEMYPGTAEALRRQEPFVVNGLGDPGLTQYEIDDYNHWGYVSSLTMPLVAAGRLVGIVDIYDDAERDWSGHIPFLTGVLQPVAGLFDNAVLIAEVEQYGRFQQQLIDLSASLARAASLDEVAEDAATRLRNICGAEDCDVWWLEEGYVRCLASVDGRGVDERVRGRVLKLGRYPAAAAALERREQLVIASPADPRLTEHEREDWEEFGFKSAFTLPLVQADELLGMIDVFDVRERDFEDVREVLLSAGGSVAGALKSATLVENLRRSNSALRELVELGDEASEAGDLTQLSRIVAQRVRDILQAEDCDIWGLDGGRMTCLASFDSRGWDEEEVGKERYIAVYAGMDAALAANEPIVIGDLDAADLPPEERAAYRHWGYRSMVSLPLVAEGRPVGLIDVFDLRVRDYTGLLDFIRSVGRMLAGAFEKALLLDRLAASNRELRILVESGMQFGSSLDVAAVLDAVAQRILEVSGADMCDVCSLDGEEIEILVSLGGEWDEDPVGLRYPVADYAAFDEAKAHRRPVVMLDVSNLAGANSMEAREAEHWGYRASMDIPLFAQGEITGFVSLYNRASRPFASEDLIVGLAQVAGQALANAALYEGQMAANRENRLLNDIAQRTAASLDLDEIVEAAVDELRHLLDFDRYSLVLADGPDTRRIITSGHDADIVAGLAETAAGAALLQRLEAERTLVLRLPEDLPLPADHPALAGVASAVLIALPSDLGIRGSLNLLGATPEAFAGVDLPLLGRVVTQLSLAIRNAQLYDEIKQMHLGNLKALSSALNAKDYYTLGHASRVAAYMVMLGRQLGWDEDLLESLEEAAYLHDIGKISISDRVLLKPGRLNQQEWQQMRQHPVFSADIIRPLFPDALVQAVRHHHERFDGGGYPDGLAGEDIPLLARAMAVVDSYDAMSCRRPYNAARSYLECLDELKACSGTQFDPAMVAAFCAVLDDVARRRKEAERIAALAAARIPGELHLRLRSKEDEDTEAFRIIAATLRDVRDANPPTRYLTTHLRMDKKFVIGVDPEEDPELRSSFGDEIFADDELPAVLSGSWPMGNTVYADEYGVWITGLAAVRDKDGAVVAAVAADMPALDGGDEESPRSDGRQTFATILQSAAVRLSRAEIDAITDALTGLYNHRYLHERLSDELHRAREVDKPLSVLFCDLDHFKQYNDAHGHSAGDKVLREIAHLIEQGVRNVDIAGRYGGEEFVVLLVETDADAALLVAERIRERIEAAGFVADGHPLTVSIGVATYPGDGERREELLERADAAMYVAKRLGRDRVVAASHLEPTATH